MLNAFIWGLIATSSLIVGGVLGMRLNFSNRSLGIVMAFGAGILISALSYELVFEAVRLAKGTGFPGMGLFAGAFTFYFADRLISKVGAGGRKSIAASHNTSLVIPMVLAIVLDGVPESMVIGLGILEEGSVSIAMLVAVFISNLPEAIAGSVGMRKGGFSGSKIFMLWTAIAIICAACTVIGYSAFQDTPDTWLAFIQAFAGGAILMMLANTMIPEAYEHGGKLAGIFTVLGFAVSVGIIIIEYSV